MSDAVPMSPFVSLDKQFSKNILGIILFLFLDFVFPQDMLKVTSKCSAATLLDDLAHPLLMILSIFLLLTRWHVWHLVQTLTCSKLALEILSCLSVSLVFSGLDNFNPDKVALFEGSFFCQFDPLFILQEELICYQYNFIRL